MKRAYDVEEWMSGRVLHWRLMYGRKAIEGKGKVHLQNCLAELDREIAKRGIKKVTRFWAPWPR